MKNFPGGKELNDVSSNFQMKRSPDDETLFEFTPSPEQGSFEANVFTVVVDFQDTMSPADAFVSELHIEACVIESPIPDGMYLHKHIHPGLFDGW